jgi:hypothetical protein
MTNENDNLMQRKNDIFVREKMTSMSGTDLCQEPNSVTGAQFANAIVAEITIRSVGLNSIPSDLVDLIKSFH